MSEESSRALAVHEEPVEATVVQLTPLTGASVTDAALAPVDVQAKTLAEYDKRRSHFVSWLLKKLDEGVHYGHPPGCKRSNAPREQWRDKPTLYKAGALLLCELLQLEPIHEPDEATWRMLGEQPGTVCFSCRLVDRRSGATVSRGRGAMENGEKRMPAGSRIKIAQKRALVDAVVTGVPGVSDLFTQDLDDGEPEKLHRNVARQQSKHARQTGKSSKPASQDPAAPQAIERLKELSEHELLTREQRSTLSALAADPNLTSGKAGVYIKKAKDAVAEAEAAMEPPPAEPDQQGMDLAPGEELPEREPGAEG